MHIKSASNLYDKLIVNILILCQQHLRMSVCVFVCEYVCEREKEKERKIERRAHTQAGDMMLMYMNVHPLSGFESLSAFLLKGVCQENVRH